MLYVSDIISRFNGKLLCGDENMILDNFCKDTRIIKNGDIYVGIKGESFDGNNFYADAFDKGAKACILDNTTLVDTDRYGDKTIILVDNTLECIGKLAKYKRSLLNIPVVAITGSVGKTSTKDMVASVLSTKYKVLKTEGNNNNNIGLPFTILRYKDEDVMVIEMGMNHFGEISYLTDIVRPTIGVITNIGTAHIGILGSRENILKAKLEIIEGLNGPLIINNDNDIIRNNIKYINDNKGHEEGDTVIKKAASILIVNQDANTDIIRTDGTEFLIYMVGYSEKDVVAYTRKIYKELKELPYGFGATIGYSMIMDDVKTVDDAINEATIDMRNKKENH